MTKKNIKKEKVSWTPLPRQELALVRPEFEVLYGGARGGGKTDAGMAWIAAYNTGNSNFRGLVIRQNAKDLSDWIDRAKEMYAPMKAEFVGQPTEIRFPSGAKVRTGHLKDENAYEQYQGHEYQNILLEELTQIPSELSYEKLISSCRTADPSITPQIFGTTNPGGPGHDWVKERWSIQDGGEIIITKTKYGNRVFIPATVHDNTHLLESAPHYVEMLKNIKDDNLRKSWYEGSWDDPILKGRVYEDEFTYAQQEGRLTSVPHDPRYPVYTYWDIGVGDATAIGFFQILPSGQWHMIDYEEDSGKSMSHYRQVLDARGYFYGGHYGPHDLKQRDKFTAESTNILAANIGLNFIVLPRAEITEGIRVTKMKLPTLFIDKQKCEKFIKAWKNYRYDWDEEKQVYSTKPVHDWSSHASDMLRTWGMALEPVLPGQNQEEFNMYSTEYN